MLISVIIPVYRQSLLVDEILSNIIRDPHPDKEIIIIVDDPDQGTKEDMDRWREHATVIEREKREGKVSALNTGASISKGDVLLFIDSDVKIPSDLLTHISEKIKSRDLIDVRKEIMDSGFFSRLVNLDYMNSFLSNLLSHKFNLIIALNGSCFAVKKEFFWKIGGFRRTVTEDIDFGIRASEHGAKVGLVNPGVMTLAPPTLKEWYIQRKRWGMGGAIVFLDHIKFILRNPGAWIPSLLLSFPSMLYVLFSIISSSVLRRLILAVIILLALRVPLPIATVMFSSITLSISILEKMLPVLLSFIIWMGIVSIISRKISWNKIGLTEMFVFYFIYSPLLMSLYFISFIRVLARRDRKKLNVEDWKV